MADEARRREIEQRVTDRFLLIPTSFWAAYRDVTYTHEVARARELLVATDISMAAEQIPLDIRERVLYRLLYDAPPAGYGPLNWPAAQQRFTEARGEETARTEETDPAVRSRRR